MFAPTPMTVLRTESAAYWLLVGIPAAVFVFSAMVTLKEPSFLPPTIVIAIMLVIAVLLVKTTTLSLTPDAIHYRSLLRRVDIALADVVGVEYATGFIAFSYKPYKRIVVTVRDTFGVKKIILNGGLFSPREIVQWIKVCNSALHNKQD